MNREGEIIILEDDEDDRMIISDAFIRVLKKHGYKNKIRFFEDGTSVVDYLTDNDVYPFLLISDINMPKVSGLN